MIDKERLQPKGKTLLIGLQISCPCATTFIEVIREIGILKRYFLRDKFVADPK
jgi:hypothetical protein